MDDGCHPREHEDLCFLCGDWRILQRIDGHRWSLDDLVTAWVAVESGPPPTRFADIGCGIGSVLSMVAWAFPNARGFGVEAQPVSADLARRSIRYNGADDRIRVRLGDLRDLAPLAPADRVDLVTGTPPYFEPGTATESTAVQRGPCRVEHRGGVEDYCAAAARLLAPDGRLVVCAATGQRDRVSRGADAAGLAVTRSVEVVPRAGKAPLLDVHVLRFDDGARAVEPAWTTLVVRDVEGQWTTEFRGLRTRMGMPTNAPDPC